MRVFRRDRGSTPALPRPRRLRATVLVALACVGFAAAYPHPAAAVGPNAVLTPTGYNANAIVRGDDTANLVVNLPFSMTWNGTTYTQIYVNMNGNCTFGSGFTGYNPADSTLAGTNANIMAPFWADVDTRNTAAAQVTYSNTTGGNVPTVNGRPAFFVNWVGVAAYNNQATPTDSFQLVIVDRSDTGAGNFDFMYNYDQVTWDIATAASTLRARVGWGRAGTGYELPGSGTAQGSASALIDTAPSATSLIQNSLSSGGQLGRYVWQVRGGAAPNIAPQVTVVNRVLEGNAHDSYVGYTGTGDATASDVDGTVVSLTNNRPTTLPLGTTSVLWTATDNRGAVTTATQTIVVEDTVAPNTPTLTSPTHTAGVWTTVNSVTVNSSASTDTCSGVRGASYVWTMNAAGTPDTTLDPSTNTTVTTTTTTTVESEAFASATWPTDWTRVLITGTGAANTYIRSQNTRAASGYAAELWANNGTRRTFGFYKDFDLSAFDSATLAFSDYTVGLAAGDYSRVDYSTDGGANWTQLQNVTTNGGWNTHSYSLPASGAVRVRFSGSVNATTKFCDWDDITILAYHSTSEIANTASSTSTLSDGVWYFNLRTVDNAGNWTATQSFGPVQIDRTAPVTTSNVPASGWVTSSPFAVNLSATDLAGVASTRYKLDSSAVATYTAPFSVSAEGTHTLLFWSVDILGNREATQTATLRIDSGAPTVPGAGGAAAVSTSSVEVTWTPSSDIVSGVAYYAIYRGGSLIATSSTPTFTDSGLTPGQTYGYQISAFDRAGLESARTAVFAATLPVSQVWLTISETNVALGGVDPGVGVTVNSATTVTVGGVGQFNYDFSCVAEDFVNSNVGSTTPTMPVGMLSYATRGWKTIPSQPFSTTATILEDGGAGSKYVWLHPYAFDYTLNVPWAFGPGTYTTHVTYTAVSE